MKSRLEALDALRGLAALAVVLFHSRVDLWVGWRAIQAAPQNFSLADRAVALLSMPIPFFGEAVMLFFIISGFCVHLPYAAGSRRFQLLPYALRRVGRIVPPYLAAIALTFAVEWLLLNLFRVPSSPWTKWLQTALMIQNYPPAPGQLSSNPSLWSIPVEMEMYLVYPLLLLSSSLTVRGWMILSALVSMLAAACHISGVMWLSGNFAEYWVLWCAGAVLAERTAAGIPQAWSTRQTILATTFLILALVCFWIRTPVIIQHYSWGAFFWMTLLWCLSEGSSHRLQHTRVWAWLVKFGAISYSLYLIHFPLFRLAGAVWQAHFGAKPASFLVPLGFSVLMIPLAAGFYLLFERPSHRWARNVSRLLTLHPLQKDASEFALSTEARPP